MLNDEEMIKQREQREKRKKIFLIAVCVVIGAFVLFGLITLILSGINNYTKSQGRERIDNATRRSYIYPEPDYDFNIFEDEGYMQSDRRIWFNDGVAKTVMTDDNYKDYSIEMQFMFKVINYIINGDYEEYNKIFTDDYIKNAGNDLRERFTMQQLFEIELEYVDYIESENKTNSDIKVTYRIRNNNGTFRNDLDFNDAGSCPVVYKLVSDSTGVKVTGLLTFYKYTTGLYD